MANEGLGCDDEIDELWQQHRRRSLDVAYRLLGSVHDAEDAVQEAYSRLLVAERDAIGDIAGWLVAVTSRICIDRLRAHERSRRAYVGPWLPEPLVDRAGFGSKPGEGADQITIDDSVRMARLVVLEQLSPAERTAFVLHDVFGVGFAEIGEIVGRSAVACRQLASRARRRIEADGVDRRFAVDRSEHDRVVRRFAAASRSGDLDGLVAVLDTDVIGDFDSGGLVVGAPLVALDGADDVARQFLWTVTGLGAEPDLAVVNGEPGLVLRVDDVVVAVVSIGVNRGLIDVIHAVGNPAKLTHVT